MIKKYLNIIIILMLIQLFVFCSQVTNKNNGLVMPNVIKNANKDSINQKEQAILDEIKESETEINKLYIVEKKAAIFFLISQKEIMQLQRESGDSYQYEMNYLFSSFNKQAKHFTKILNKYNIISALVKNKRFQIKLDNGESVYFSRVREDQIMGEIFTDGIQQPVIVYGMYSNKDLLKQIKTFFKIDHIDMPEALKDTIRKPFEQENLSDSTDLSGE